jgi:hypothetical protein
MSGRAIDPPRSHGDFRAMRRPVPALLLVCLSLVCLRAPALAEPDSAQTGDCIARLASVGIAAERAEIKAADAACGVAEPVRVLTVREAGGRVIRLPDRPILSCAMAERFGRFAADMAAPLALGVHGKALTTVWTGPGFECRPRNRVAGAKMSSHSRGEAVDIMGVELQGGQRITVEGATGDALRFVTALRAAACGVFSTVLGPGADAAHADHLHLDIEARGRDGRTKLCQ